MNEKVYTIEELKEGFSKIVKTGPFEIIKKIYLFGSYARGEATAKSDIDIVVETFGKPSIRLFGLYDYIEDVFGKHCDVLTVNEIRDLCYETYLRERVLVYDRKRVVQKARN